MDNNGDNYLIWASEVSVIHVRRIFSVFEGTLIYCGSNDFPREGEIVIYWEALSDDISNNDKYTS